LSDKAIRHIRQTVNEFNHTMTASLPAVSTDWAHAVGSLAIIQLLGRFLMKTILALLLTSTFVLTGCNTVAGAGKDLERGGEKVQDTARDTQEKM